jgi:MFS family permease
MNPFLEAPNRKKLTTLAGIYLSVISSLFVSTSVSTLLPLAAEEVGGAQLYPLASTLGGVFGVIIMPLYGYLGTKYPEKKRTLLMASLVIGALVCFVRAIAPNMMVIIIVSIFWAFTSAGIYVISFTMVRDIYPADRAGTLLGMAATMMSIGNLAGPTVVGFLIDRFGWRFASHAVWPFMLVAAVVIFFGVKVNRTDAAGMSSGGKAFDVPGCIAFALFLGGIILALSLGPASRGTAYLPFGSFGSNALLVLAAVGLIAFIIDVKKKGDQAILPTSVLKDRNTVLLAACTLLTIASSMAVFFFLPAYVRGVMHGSATEAGLTVTMNSIAGLFLGPILGRMIAKERSARKVITLGTIVRIAVTLSFIFLLNEKTPIMLVLALCLGCGVYSAQAQATGSTAPQVQIDPKIRVMSNSVIQLAQSLGGSVGMAVYSMIIGMFGVAKGLRPALIVAAALAGAVVILCQFLRPLTAGENQA